MVSPPQPPRPPLRLDAAAGLGGVVFGGDVVSAVFGEYVMAEHTPLPWIVIRRNKWALDLHVHPDADHRVSGRFIGSINDVYGTGEENAALIVHRVNTWEELEEALRALVELGRKDLSNSKYDGYFESARAALQRAEAR